MAPPEPPASIPAFTRNRRQPASSTASQTQTETNAAPHPHVAIPIGTLRLRAAAAPNDTRVRWAEDVIDNEGLGRKRSKGSSFKMSQLSLRCLGRNAMERTAQPRNGRALADVLKQFAASTTRRMKSANHLQTRRHRIQIRTRKAVEVMMGERGWAVRERERENGMSMMGRGIVGNMGIRGRQRDEMRMRANQKRRVVVVRSRSLDKWYPAQ